MTDKSTNAGVHGSTGIEFQKHCALYLLFEKYSEIKDRQYFICLEHHDDFLFCYQTQAQLITSIDAYQAKKSSSQWNMGVELSKILKKITEVGVDLLADPHPKDPDYSHTLNFITNNSVQLHCGKKKNRKSVLINDSNNGTKYIDLDIDIRTNILKGLKKEVVSIAQISELDKLSVTYIDLPKKAKGQKENIIGQFISIFGSQVNDPTAAVDTLLLLFRDVENVLNNGNIAQLLDKSKRVESSVITKAINIITQKTKAYQFWRKRSDELGKKILIPIFEKEKFLLQFQNSLDLFKDLKQTEHQKLYKYVSNNKSRWAHHTDEVECISDIYNSFIGENSTNLNSLDIKAAVCAAYLEIKE